MQRLYNGTPIFYTTENDESIVTIRANSLQPSGDLGLNLTGAGLLAGVWDGGKVRETHQELSGTKIEFGDGATSFSAHSTHVTGTICAKGFVPRARALLIGCVLRFGLLIFPIFAKNNHHVTTCNRHRCL